MPRINQEANQALIEQYNPRTGNWVDDTKNILLRFLQHFFHEMPKGQGCFHLVSGGTDYTIDEKETELIITDQGAWNTDSVEKRPVIIISRSPYQYANVALDQLKSLSFATAQREHTDLVQGSFTINCLSQNGLEAELLAQYVARAIRYYRRNLQRAGFFYIGHIVQVGSESPPGSLIGGDAKEDWVNVPVSVPFVYQDYWKVSQDAVTLNTIRFRAEVVFKSSDWQLRYPDSYNPDGSVNESSLGVVIEEWTVTGEEP